MSLKPITLWIHEDEKAHALREQNLIRPPVHQWRRWQIVTVYRDDVLTEWWTDLGPMEAFANPGVEIPSLGEHTVAELRDIAEKYRLGDDYWRKRAAECQADSTIIRDIIAQVEEKGAITANRSSFGPLVTHQRNGFDRRAFHELVTGSRRTAP